MWSESARKTAEIEGRQHREHLEKEGVLGLRRPVGITATPWQASPEQRLEPNQKVVHLIRHGQAFHNLMADVYRDHGKFVDSVGKDKQADNPYQRPEMLDPPLTALGREQAKALRPACKSLPSVELVVASPLRRATETALLAFSHMANGCASGSKFLGHQDISECSGKNICDKRRALEEIKAEFTSVDWSQIVDEEDPLWTEERESARGLSDRGYSFLMWLQARPEKEVAVASHSAWLFSLLNTTVECADPALEQWFLTGEMRSVVLQFSERSASESDDAIAKRQRCK